MQHGQVKHYNSDKGYGFIDVDNQQEDVFFHISNWQLSQTPQVGQHVYFTSERNNKNKLNAIQVSANPIKQSHSSPNRSSNRSSNNASINSSRKPAGRAKNNQSVSAQPSTRALSNKKSGFTRIFSMLAVLIAVILGGTKVFSTLSNQQSGNNNSDVSVSSTSSQSTEDSTTTTKSITGDAQVDNTIALIKRGGPYPYPDKDGTVFYNREGRLPLQSRGYYHEYTVPTLGLSHRGAKRIVTGGNPPEVYYLTLDHYDSFTKLNVD